MRSSIHERMFLIFLAAFLCIFPCQADQLTGKVIKIADGDTVTILTANHHQERIRLSGIDAPEKTQAFGNLSKQALANAIFNKIVAVDWNKRDRYERIVGKILLNGKDVNLQQVKHGLAWHYKAYEREQDVEDRSTYANAEYEAERDKLGLWVEKQPIPPWEFRKSKRKGRF